MQQIKKFIPVIILTVVAALLFLGEKYLEQYQEKMPLLVKYRVHLSIGSIVAAVIYYFMMIRDVKKPIDEKYDEYLPSYEDSNMSYSL